MHKPIEDLIEASDTYGNKRMIPRPPKPVLQFSDEARIILQQIEGRRGFMNLAEDRQEAYLSEPGEFAKHEIAEIRAKLEQANMISIATPVDQPQSPSQPGQGTDERIAA